MAFHGDKYDRAWCDEHQHFPDVMFLGPNEGYDHWWAVQKAVASWRSPNTAKITLLADDNVHEDGQVVEFSQLMSESPHLARFIETYFPRDDDGILLNPKHGESMRLATVRPRQLRKISEFLYTNDYCVTEDDVRSVQGVHGPTCKTCLNYLRLLNFHLDVFQAGRDVDMPGLQLVALERFMRVMDSASERVLLNIVREVYQRRWPTDERNEELYRLRDPAVGIVSHDHRADLVVPTCTRFLVQLRIRRDMVVGAGRVPSREVDEVQYRMDLLRKTVPGFDWHMQCLEGRYRI